MKLLSYEEVVKIVKAGCPCPILTVVRDKKRFQGGWDANWCTSEWNYLADWLKTDEKKGYGQKWIGFTLDGTDRLEYLDAITRIMKELETLKRERDTLLKYLAESRFVPCDICKHDTGGGVMGCKRVREIHGPCFEWRGVPEDKEKAELAKRLEIANSSPFPQGMTQAEYFGLVEEDKP